MHRIYRSTQRLLAAQILSIAMPPAVPDSTAPADQLLLIVDTGEQFTVPAAWASSQGVQAGGYLGLLGQHEKGQAVFIPASSFATSFEYLGDVPGSEPKTAAPETPPSPETTYTFDQFVAYGIANGGNVVDGMPWSFAFHGRPVSHENNDRYLITTREGKTLDFHRGETLHVDADGSLWVEGA